MSRITAEILRQLAPQTVAAKRSRFLPVLNEVLPRYGITSALEVRAFLATGCFESDFFKTCEEYASGWDYDVSRNPKKARALGNTVKGDGPKFKGGGFFQYTGKANHRQLTEELGAAQGADFVAHPELLKKDLRWAVESAAFFWQKHELGKYAARGEFDRIQGIVNRGDANKLAKDFGRRRKLYEIAAEAIPDDFVLTSISTDPAPAPATASNPATQSVESAAEASPAAADTSFNDAPGTQQADFIANVQTGDASASKAIAAAAAQPPVAVPAPEPTGFLGKAWKILAAASGTPILASLLEKSGAVTDAQIELFKFVFPYVFYGAIAALLVWFVTKKLNNFHLTKLFVDTNADLTKRDIVLLKGKG